MFKRATTPTFWHPVTVEYTCQDGARSSATFDVEFKRKAVGEINALVERNRGVDDADLLFMQEVVTGWRKVPDDDGNDVPFSLDALRQLYDIGFGAAVVKAYFKGIARAKEKN